MIMELSSVVLSSKLFTYISQFNVRKYNIYSYIRNSDLANISMSNDIIDKISIIKGKECFLMPKTTNILCDIYRKFRKFSKNTLLHQNNVILSNIKSRNTCCSILEIDFKV